MFVLNYCGFFYSLVKCISMKKNRTKEEILRKLEEAEALIQRVVEGEEVSCSECGNQLYYKGPKSGVHPGVYCGLGCTEILLEIGRS